MKNDECISYHNSIQDNQSLYMRKDGHYTKAGLEWLQHAQSQMLSYKHDVHPSKSITSITSMMLGERFYIHLSW